ncbi:MAG TPA: CooT family nickel-binding protein [Clostridia bacterium]|jgi:predicted RNA-binding protein|nr:CooT family nickel-binding protein [Clostridia bacterium]
MCESNVYINDSEGGEVLLLEKVDKIIPKDDELFMENIFGERKILKARIKEMALVDHRIVIEKL